MSTEREPALTWQLSLLAECPYCGSDDLAVSYATELGVWDWCSFEVRAIAGELDEAEIGGEDAAIKGFCRACRKSFSIELTPKWEDTSASTSVFVQFSATGLPTAIRAGDVEAKNIRVHNVRPLQSWRNDPLLGVPPFGVLSLYMMAGNAPALCELEVRPAGSLLEEDFGSWDCERLYCWLRSTDKALIQRLSEAATRAYEFAWARGERPPWFSPQPVDDWILRRAALVLIGETEKSCRSAVWRHLGDVFNSDRSKSDWWKAGGLPNGVSKYIQETAEKDGNRDFSCSQADEYITIGHVRETLKDRWKHFSKYLPRQERVLLTIQKFEDVRNGVVHFRRINPAAYRSLKDTSSELLRFFAPLVGRNE